MGILNQDWPGPDPAVKDKETCMYAIGYMWGTIDTNGDDLMDECEYTRWCVGADLGWDCIKRTDKNKEIFNIRGLHSYSHSSLALYLNLDLRPQHQIQISVTL